MAVPKYYEMYRSFLKVLMDGNIHSMKEEKQQEWNQLTVPEHMVHYLEKGMDKKSAMKQVAKDRGVSKRDIYQELLKK